MNNNEYQIKLPNYQINIFDKEDIKILTQKIVRIINKKYILNNLIIIDIYHNKQYGIITEIKNNTKLSYNNDKEIRIIIHNDIPFLYKVDYLYILDNRLINEKIYYYNNNFYLEIKDTISYSKYINLLENADIIYKDTLDIINNGLEIKI